MNRSYLVQLGAVAAAGLLAGCSNDPSGSGTRLEFADRSLTPALVKDLLPGARAYTLLGSDDRLAESPAFTFGGSADGMGIMRSGGGYTLLSARLRVRPLSGFSGGCHGYVTETRPRRPTGARLTNPCCGAGCRDPARVRRVRLQAAVPTLVTTWKAVRYTNVVRHS